jgi:hypothetical protein
MADGVATVVWLDNALLGSLVFFGGVIWVVKAYYNSINNLTNVGNLKVASNWIYLLQLNAFVDAARDFFGLIALPFKMAHVIIVKNGGWLLHFSRYSFVEWLVILLCIITVLAVFFVIFKTLLKFFKSEDKLGCIKMFLTKRLLLVFDPGRAVGLLIVLVVWDIMSWFYPSSFANSCPGGVYWVLSVYGFGYPWMLKRQGKVYTSVASKEVISRILTSMLALLLCILAFKGLIFSSEPALCCGEPGKPEVGKTPPSSAMQAYRNFADIGNNTNAPGGATANPPNPGGSAQMKKSRPLLLGVGQVLSYSINWGANSTAIREAAYRLGGHFPTLARDVADGMNMNPGATVLLLAGVATSTAFFWSNLTRRFPNFWNVTAGLNNLSGNTRLNQSYARTIHYNSPGFRRIVSRVVDSRLPVASRVNTLRELLERIETRRLQNIERALQQTARGSGDLSLPSQSARALRTAGTLFFAILVFPPVLGAVQRNQQDIDNGVTESPLKQALIAKKQQEESKGK